MAENKKKQTPQHHKEKEVKQPVIKKDFMAYTDAFFQKHVKKVFWGGIFFTCLFGALLFDLKISEGTDDSGYIMAAFDFIKGKSFPSWHGSFYPIFLSLPILIFGLNLFVLKFISYLLMVGHFIILFKTFENRVRPTILALVALFTAICSDILFFSSSTFSEPLYFFLQALTLFYFFKIIDHIQSGQASLKENWKLWLLFGLFTFLFATTRNVGLGVLIAIIIYFIVNRHFREALYGIGSFLVFQLPYSLYKNIFWKQAEIGFEGQFKVMFQKNAYNAALGNEDFKGFVDRFLTNSDLYLSKHFFKILGLRNIDSIETSTLLTFVLYGLFILAFVMAFKHKDKVMQFLALYLPVAIGGTFISQQTSWDQARLIIVYVPVILIFLSFGLYKLFEKKSNWFIQFSLVVFLGIVLIATLNRTFDKVKINQPILTKQIWGNKYAGFTPDWVHFFQASEWAAKNLPKEAVIASRKPSMSFMYGKGREFYGIYKIPDIPKDTAVKQMLQRNADVLILDNYELQEKITMDLYESIRLYNKFMIVGTIKKRMPDGSEQHDNRFYTVIEPEPEKKDVIVNALLKRNISFRTDLENFSNEFNCADCQFFAEDADNLVKTLKDANVEYMIVANLRATKIKDGNIINTLQRYMTYIQLKYPQMFVPIQQFGTPDDEPAIVYQLVYPY